MACIRPVWHSEFVIPLRVCLTVPISYQLLSYHYCMEKRRLCQDLEILRRPLRHRKYVINRSLSVNRGHKWVSPFECLSLPPAAADIIDDLKGPLWYNYYLESFWLCR